MAAGWLIVTERHIVRACARDTAGARRLAAWLLTRESDAHLPATELDVLQWCLDAVASAEGFA